MMSSNKGAKNLILRFIGRKQLNCFTFYSFFVQFFYSILAIYSPKWAFIKTFISDFLKAFDCLKHLLKVSKMHTHYLIKTMLRKKAIEQWKEVKKIFKDTPHSNIIKEKMQEFKVKLAQTRAKIYHCG